MVARTIGRLVLVPVAFLLAAVTAGFVTVTLGLEQITHAMHGREPGPETVDAAFDVLSEGLRMAAGLSLVPALAVIIVGEVARLRSWLYYVAGGGLALAILPLLGQLGEVQVLQAPPAALWQTLATAGFSGGFVYWLVAGRTA